MITVTKSFTPPIEEYIGYIKQIFERGTFTNQGPLLKQLESELKTYLDVKDLHVLSNGTMALQLSLRSLDITEGEVITTPFSYVATVSSILWERCTPVFVDIEQDNFTIDPGLIEDKITSRTKAIMPVHVFGYACDIDKIDEISKKYSIPVIYDAAHAFGTRYKQRSLFDFGDVSACSFHSTKLFHTIEGGACVTSSSAISKKLELIKKFGHQLDDHFMLGINAKNSEVHAAMGLVNLKYVNENIEVRRHISELYDELLAGCLVRPKKQKHIDYNYAYYPVVFKSEEVLLKAKESLEREDIFIRRYFYPSLNTLPYLESYCSCPISEDITTRIACLPLYVGLKDDEIEKIVDIIKKVVW